MDTVAVIGLATAVFAATIGLAQNDIKKVFAYSTVSQLGYMFLGVGVGRFSAGIFHLMTHAFFKALLFLGAGSVIHALSGEQDHAPHGRPAKKIADHLLRRCSAPASRSPAFRLPPGYFSKDAILEAAYEHAPWMYWLGDHRRHDRLLRLPRAVPDVLRASTEATAIRTNRRRSCWAR